MRSARRYPEAIMSASLSNSAFMIAQTARRASLPGMLGNAMIYGYGDDLRVFQVESWKAA